MINFRVLGPIEVTKDDQLLALGGRKQRVVLAILLLNVNRVVPVDRLITGVWGDAVPGHPLNTLQVYVSNLRRILGPDDTEGDQRTIITQEPGYRIQAESEQLDMLKFLTAVGAGRRLLDENRYEEAAGTLREALALWRGPALADLVADSFISSELAGLEESHLMAIEARIEADLALGRAAEIIGELEGLLVAHPYRERLHGLLMSALYRCGRQAEALQAYQAARQILLDDLGVDPGPELREVERAILAQVKLGNMTRRAHPFVLFHDGNGEQYVVDLDTARSPLTIGRRSSNDLSLSWDQEVSRVHAYLERADDGWELVDEGRSRNGSYVNGERIESRQLLRDTDVIRLGKTVLLYRAPTPVAGIFGRDAGVIMDGSSRTITRIEQKSLAVLRSLTRIVARTGGRADECVKSRAARPIV